KLSGIDKDFKIADGGTGRVERDPATGEPTGILRACTRYVKVQSSGRQPSDLDRAERVLELFRDYNANGITGILDRDASTTAIKLYRQLHEKGLLRVRIAISQSIGTSGATENIQKNIRNVA